MSHLSYHIDYEVMEEGTGYDVNSPTELLSEFHQTYLDETTEAMAISKRETLEKNIIEARGKFIDKFNDASFFSSEFSLEEAWPFFKDVYINLIESGGSDIRFTFTEYISIFFQASLAGNNGYFELFFDFDDNNNLEIELITNIYKSKNNTIGYSGSIEDVFSRIQNDNISENIQYFRFEQTILPFQDVPKGTFTTATF